MPAAADSEMMYVYKGGRIVYAQEVTAVDDVQVAEGHSRLTILDKEGATLYESPMGDVDSLSPMMQSASCSTRSMPTVRQPMFRPAR